MKNYFTKYKELIPALYRIAVLEHNLAVADSELKILRRQSFRDEDEIKRLNNRIESLLGGEV
jgi:hypothetical protein